MTFARFVFIFVFGATYFPLAFAETKIEELSPAYKTVHVAGVACRSSKFEPSFLVARKSFSGVATKDSLVKYLIDSVACADILRKVVGKIGCAKSPTLQIELKDEGNDEYRITKVGAFTEQPACEPNPRSEFMRQLLYTEQLPEVTGEGRGRVTSVSCTLIQAYTNDYAEVPSMKVFVDGPSLKVAGEGLGLSEGARDILLLATPRACADLLQSIVTSRGSPQESVFSLGVNSELFPLITTLKSDRERL